MPSNLPTLNLPASPEYNIGLEETNQDLTRAKRRFVDVNNEVGFSAYKDLLKLGGHKRENMVFSPLSLTTSLAMVFLGARGSTSWQINEVLKMDEMISFNPHLMYKNVTDAVGQSSRGGQEACVKQIFIDEVRCYRFVTLFASRSAPRFINRRSQKKRRAVV